MDPAYGSTLVHWGLNEIHRRKAVGRTLRASEPVRDYSYLSGILRTFGPRVGDGVPKDQPRFCRGVSLVVRLTCLPEFQGGRGQRTDGGSTASYGHQALNALERNDAVDRTENRIRR